MARPIVLVPLAVLSTAGLVSCSMYLEANGGDRGPTVTQEREVSDVAALDFDASGDVVLSVGEPSLTLTGGENDGSGHVRLAGESDRLTVRIPGSGDVDAGDLTAQDVVAAVGGSGSIDLRAEHTLDASVDGSGTITYSGGAAVRTSVSGSGRVAER